MNVDNTFQLGFGSTADTFLVVASRVRDEYVVQYHCCILDVYVSTKATTQLFYSTKLTLLVQSAGFTLINTSRSHIYLMSRYKTALLVNKT